MHGNDINPTCLQISSSRDRKKTYRREFLSKENGTGLEET